MKGLLKRAVVNGEVLEMIYLNSKGEISQRRIKVIKFNDESFSVYCTSWSIKSFRMLSIF
ncbi:hypothetical protein [Niallia circulans]|uniref:hypothetical protein n=1 Tax=Niallia circulans TaxID=1397 RepID=UPI003524FA29